jgi:hypothetical protein
MTNERTAPRFRVSNIGYAFAVHDTAVRQEYAFEAGRDRAHRSTNPFNTRIVEIVPTSAQAQAIADRLNAEAERGSAAG